jgi:hypothetical protein
MIFVYGYCKKGRNRNGERVWALIKNDSSSTVPVSDQQAMPQSKKRS